MLRGLAMPARLVALAALALTAMPVAAHAGFSEDLVPVSEVFTNGGGQALATNPAGDALVVWTSSPDSLTKRTAKARRIKADGTVGPVLTLSDGLSVASGPAVTFAGDGRAVVVWAEAASSADDLSLAARVIAPDDALGAIKTIRTGGADSDSASASVSPSGNGDTVLIVWHNFASVPGPFRRVEASHMKTDGTVGPLIVPDSTAGATGVQGVPDAAGGTLLVWKQGPPVKGQNIASNDSKGTIRTPESDASSGATIAADGHGEFALLYSNSAPGMQFSLDFRGLAPDGSGGTERNIDPLASSFVGGGLIAMNSSTRALVGWTRDNTAKARFIDSTQMPEPQTFSAPNAAGNQATTGVGIGGSGAGAISFQLSTPTGETSTWGRVIPAAGPAPEPVLLSPPGPITSSGDLRVAANDVGAVTWSTNDSGAIQLFARQILPPPTCSDTTGTIDKGRSTAIALPCTGLQLRGAEVVGQPSHGTLTAPDGPSQSVLYTPEPGYEGPDSFAWRGRNAGGPANATQTATLTVHKAPRDRLAPFFNRFKLSPRRVRLSGPRRTKKTTLRMGLSEAATVVVTIERKHRCPRRRRRCNKFPRFGALTSRPPPGLTATVTFKKRIGRRRLTAGSYRASAIATDLAGNHSKVRRVSFRVVRR
jgi:hypothetical protein